MLERCRFPKHVVHVGHAAHVQLHVKDGVSGCKMFRIQSSLGPAGYNHDPTNAIGSTQTRYISDTLSQALTSEIEVIRLAGALVRDVQFEVGRRLLSRSAHPVAMDRSIAIVACELGLHNKTQ